MPRLRRRSCRARRAAGSRALPAPRRGRPSPSASRIGSRRRRPGLDRPVPRWSTSRMSRYKLSALNCRLRSAAASVAASPGPPARNVTASFRAGFENAGRTTTWSPIVRPFGFAAVLRDDEGAAAGVDPLHHARLRRPRPLRLARKERSVDADADAGGGHQADQKPHNPPKPMNPTQGRVRTRRHGRTVPHLADAPYGSKRIPRPCIPRMCVIVPAHLIRHSRTLATC